MRKSEFKAGDFLYGIPGSAEGAKYHPEDERVFIHTGYVDGDGYGILLGWNDHRRWHAAEVKQLYFRYP